MAHNDSHSSIFAAHEPPDPFAGLLVLSREHPRLVPMRRVAAGYGIEPAAQGWCALTPSRGFAGYGMGRALRMLLDVLHGLMVVHETTNVAGEAFVHGDVSVDKLRVDLRGVCRLVPLTERHFLGDQATPAREALGCLAPERLLGHQLDARADVFSVGVLLWEALAGRRLFTEVAPHAIIDRLMCEPLRMPPIPRELAWAEPLEHVAKRALAPDPYRRFASCATLATAIASVASEHIARHADVVRFFGGSKRAVERRARFATAEHHVHTESAIHCLFAHDEITKVSRGVQPRPAPSPPALPQAFSTAARSTLRPRALRMQYAEADTDDGSDAPERSPSTAPSIEWLARDEPRFYAEQLEDDPPPPSMQRAPRPPPAAPTPNATVATDQVEVANVEELPSTDAPSLAPRRWRRRYWLFGAALLSLAVLAASAVTNRQRPPEHAPHGRE